MKISLPAKWLLTITAFTICLVLTDAGLARTAWREKYELIAPDDTAVWGTFGYSVSMSGDYVIIGAFSDDGEKGSAYIFKWWEGESWLLQQKLIASDGDANDWFGHSVAISGDYAIIGAYRDDTWTGSAYIFKLDDEKWIQKQKLIASDPFEHHEFGYSVSISGDYAAVGSAYEGKGTVYIFKCDGESWVQQQKLTASDEIYPACFGWSVCINGDYLIAGAISGDGNQYNTGSAYIFKRDGENWIQQQKLIASDGVTGVDFGCSVSISGDYAIVGAYWDREYGNKSGAAYIFRRTDTGWFQQQKLVSSDISTKDEFGKSVSISGDYAIVGAWNNDWKGSAYIFRRDGENWIQQKKLSNPQSGDLGECVYISKDYAIISDRIKDTVYMLVQTDAGTPKIFVPNGGEELIAGSGYDIVWDTNGIIENVLIEYSANNGFDWVPIATAANTGSYSWTVADIDSNQCLVRISDADSLSAGDVSDDVFRIYRCTLIYDTNHDCYIDFYDLADFASKWLECSNPTDPNCLL